LRDTAYLYSHALKYFTFKNLLIYTHLQETLQKYILSDELRLTPSCDTWAKFNKLLLPVLLFTPVLAKLKS
jgi:hypothetical protein